MPRCEKCPKTANVVYRATSTRPVPRCWDHTPPLHEAIATGLIEDHDLAAATA
jgi:hypothetical protein